MANDKNERRPDSLLDHHQKKEQNEHRGNGNVFSDYSISISPSNVRCFDSVVKKVTDSWMDLKMATRSRFAS